MPAYYGLIINYQSQSFVFFLYTQIFHRFNWIGFDLRQIPGSKTEY